MHVVQSVVAWCSEPRGHVARSSVFLCHLPSLSDVLTLAHSSAADDSTQILAQLNAITNHVLKNVS